MGVRPRALPRVGFTSPAPAHYLCLMPHKSPQVDPRSLLEALRARSALPELPPDAVRRAQDLATGPAASAADVEALPEPLALAVLEGTVLAGQPALAEALATGSHKALAKAAKKALYRLRSAGVELHEPARPAAPEPPRAPPETLPALLTSIDGAGERVLELARLLRGGGVETLQFLYSDELGVTQVQTGELNRAEFRQMLKQATRPGPDAVVELSHAEGLERLAAAAGQNLRARTPFPPGLDTLLRQLEVQPREETWEPGAPEPDDERLAHEAHTLHDTEEMRGWLPPVAELETLAHTVTRHLESRLALTPAQRNAEIFRAAQAQAQAFFTSLQVRRLYARRLWEMALHFERLGQQHACRVARAEARRLAQGASPPASRFAERLYEKALLVTLARVRAAAPRPEGPTAIPPPAHAEPRARPVETERRSPGGIILP